MYDDKWRILEPLIYVKVIPAHSSIRCWWRPMLNCPGWAFGRRDLEFTTYWVKI